MTTLWKKWQLALLFTVLLLALTACANSSDGRVRTKSNSDGIIHPSGLHNPDTIPNYHGPKTQTTNEHGKTTSGMGTTVYSLIGSSSLHEGGIATHMQSRLTSKGIDGVKVLVLGDTVVLARSEPQMSSHQYDEMQMKVLSQTEGLSGKGEPNEGVLGDTKATGDNLAHAKKQVQAMFGGNVHILAITDPQAPQLIERITSKLQASPADHSVAKDISELLKIKVDKE